MVGISVRAHEHTPTSTYAGECKMHIDMHVVKPGKNVAGVYNN